MISRFSKILLSFDFFVISISRTILLILKNHQKIKKSQPELKGIMREEAEGISLFLRLGQVNIKEYDKNNIIIKPQREIEGIMRVEKRAIYPFLRLGQENV
jgi:hypothetical protein